MSIVNAAVIVLRAFLVPRPAIATERRPNVTVRR